MFKIGDGVKLTKKAEKRFIEETFSEEGKLSITEGIVVYIKSAHDRNTELMKDSDYSGGWSYKQPLLTVYNNKGDYEALDSEWLELDDSVLKRMDANKILDARNFNAGDKVRITESARNHFSSDILKEGTIIKMADGPTVPLAVYKNEEGKINTLAVTWLEKIPAVSDPDDNKTQAGAISV